MLNGVVNYDFWAPEPTMLAFPGIKEFLKEYQARAEKAGVDPLGYYLPPNSYALVQVLGQAVEATDRKSTRLNSSHLVISYAVSLFRKSTRLNSSHLVISYAVFCLKKKTREKCRTCVISYSLIRCHQSRHCIAQDHSLRALARIAH